jgi:hypothetical protein
MMLGIFADQHQNLRTCDEIYFELFGLILNTKKRRKEKEEGGEEGVNINSKYAHEKNCMRQGSRLAGRKQLEIYFLQNTQRRTLSICELLRINIRGCYV